MDEHIEDIEVLKPKRGRPKKIRSDIPVAVAEISADGQETKIKAVKKTVTEMNREEFIFYLVNRLSKNDFLFDNIDEFIESLGYTENKVAKKFKIYKEERIIYEVERQRRRKIALAKANALNNPKGLEFYLKAMEFNEHQIHKVSPSYKVEEKSKQPKIDVRIEGGLTDEQRQQIANQNETPD